MQKVNDFVLLFVMALIMLVLAFDCWRVRHINKMQEQEIEELEVQIIELNGEGCTL